LQRFLAGPGGDAGIEDAERVFVAQLERARVPEWQVRQAARTVQFYERRYLQYRQEQGGAGPGLAAALPAACPWRPATLDQALAESRRLMLGLNPREVRKSLRHNSVETIMVYTHVTRGIASVAVTPLELLAGSG
jgi:hypothetical protein